MNERYPAALDELMEFLRALPGVGKRSAERMALQFLTWDEGRLEAFGSTVGSLKKLVGFCPVCGNLTSMEMAGEELKASLCPICLSPSRDRSVLCVVEEFPQIRSIESSNVFRGVYHVLGGRIAPLEGRGVESITADALEKRLESGAFREIIFALSPDVEGQATALYLDKRFKRFGLRTSRLAQGLPAGSDLSYADPATVAAALSNRTSFEKADPAGGEDGGI
ncbi:MAG: recombination protein RecR [Lentisphaeria bacterium]|nr:recombination protein RecR [Lentisphaeria bacterium]